MKLLSFLAATLAVIFCLTAPVAAASLDRVGIKLDGESTWIVGVRFVSPQTGAITVTTEDYVKGRAIDSSVLVLPAGSFDPAVRSSAFSWARGYFDTVLADFESGDMVEEIVGYDCSGPIIEKHRERNNW